MCEVRDRLAAGYAGNKWVGDSNGIYTVRAGYKWLMGEQRKMDLHYALWNKLNIPRHSFIMWVVVQRRLVTLDRLQEWIPSIIEVHCILCGSATETHNHLFYECEYSKKLLHMCANWLSLRRVPHKLQSWRHWLAHATRRKLKKHGVWSATFAALVYHIWEERNGRKHGFAATTVEVRFKRIKAEVLLQISGTTTSSWSGSDHRFLQSIRIT